MFAWMNDPFLVKATIIVGSGGLIFGYDIGVISGTLSTLQTTFDLTSYEEGLVVSILYAGSIAGCLLGGPLCDYFGRWKTIQIQNLIFLIGALLTGFAMSKNFLYAGRFLVGIASAISGLADVPYLTEIAPAEFRGIISGQYEILVAFGILLSFGLDVVFDLFPGGWRIAFLIPGFFAIAQSVGMLFLPESPKWLLSKKNVVQARIALVNIHGEETLKKWHQLFSKHCDGHNDIVSPTDSIPIDVISLFIAEEERGDSDYTNGSNNNTNSYTDNNSIVNNKNVNNGTHSKSDSWVKHLLGDSNERQLISDYRYPIFLVVLFQIISQITGSNVVRNYAAVIFEHNGASKRISLILNAVLGVVKWVFTIIAVFYVEEQGRRWLFLVGAGMVTIGMLILSISSVFSPGFNLHNIVVFIMGCVMIYAGFGVGYGPIPWILSSEMIPTDIRGRIISWSLIASNLAQLVTNMLFLPVTHAWTTTGSFGIFGLLNIFSWIFIYYLLCETKDVLPAEIKKQLLVRYEMFRRKMLSGACLTGSWTMDSPLTTGEGGYGRVEDDPFPSNTNMMDVSVSAAYFSDNESTIKKQEENNNIKDQTAQNVVYQTSNPLF